MTTTEMQDKKTAETVAGGPLSDAELKPGPAAKHPDPSRTEKPPAPDDQAKDEGDEHLDDDADSWGEEEQTAGTVTGASMSDAELKSGPGSKQPDAAQDQENKPDEEQQEEGDDDDEVVDEGSPEKEEGVELPSPPVGADEPASPL